MIPRNIYKYNQELGKYSSSLFQLSELQLYIYIYVCVLINN